MASSTGKTKTTRTTPKSTAVERPTAASEWRSPAKEGFLIELPSGKRARVRRSMNMMSMLKAGKIPNPLADVIQSMIAKRQSAPDLENADPEATAQFMDMVDKCVMACFVDPRVEEEPEDWGGDYEWEPTEGAISLSDIEVIDKTYVFAFAQGNALDVASFRQETARLMAVAPDGQGVAHTPSDAGGGE